MLDNQKLSKYIFPLEEEEKNSLKGFAGVNWFDVV